MTLLRARGVVVPSARRRLVRPFFVALVIVSSFALACVPRDRAPSPDASAATNLEPVAPVPTAPPQPPATNADPGTPAQPGPPKAEPGTSTACNVDSDCRTFSDACSICSCRPFAKTSADPKCAGKRISCLIDPCTGLRAICRKGNCMIGDPGDAAAPNATDAARKDATFADGAGKRTDGAAVPAASAAPKVADAASRD